MASCRHPNPRALRKKKQHGNPNPHASPPDVYHGFLQAPQSPPRPPKKNKPKPSMETRALILPTRRLPLPPTQNRRRDADLAKSEASRTLREKEALRERVAMLQSATDRAAEAAEAAARDRDEAKVAAATAGQRAQQERDELAEAEGENEGLRARLQMAEEEMAGLAADADQVGRRGELALRRLRGSACGPRYVVVGASFNEYQHVFRGRLLCHSRVRRETCDVARH